MIPLKKLALILIPLSSLGVGAWVVVNKFTPVPGCYFPPHPIRTVAEGLDQYKLKHGAYPSFENFPAMVSNSSPLVTENMIPVGVQITDTGGHRYVAHSTSLSYLIECSDHSCTIEAKKLAPSQP